MAAPRQETFVRTTDIVADRAASRLGNSGTDDLKDLIDRINTAFRTPIEVRAQSPNTTIVDVSRVTRDLPDGTRMGMMRDGVIAPIGDGTIDFSTGSVTSGSVASFTVPTMTAGFYVRALIQYNASQNILTATFGTEDAALASTGAPAMLTGYQPISLVELHSTTGGLGAFDVISQADLIRLEPGFSDPGPSVQSFTVVAPQDVFVLTQFKIPANRDRLMVTVNGQVMVRGDDYSVTDDTATFVEQQPENAVVTFKLI